MNNKIFCNLSRRITLLIAFGLGLGPIAASASSTRIKVKKVKGQMALVQFQGSLVDGQSYLLAGENQTAQDLHTGPRQHRLGMSFNFATLSSKAADIESKPSEISLTFDYGWVKGHHEGGPLVGYSSVNSGFGGATTTILAGVFYDYNFEENVEPLAYLFGVGARLTYATTTSANGTSGLYASTAYPNLFWKWWAFGKSTALRWDVGYYYESAKISAALTSTTSGIKSTGALIFYY